MSLLSGPGGVGKSLFAIQVGISLAIGRDLMSLSATPDIPARRALIINNEDTYNEMRLRMAAIFAHFGIDVASVDDRLHFLSGTEKQVRVCTRYERQLYATKEAGYIEAYITEHSIDAVIIDPLVSTHEGSENDNAEMDQVMSVYRGIASRTNAGVLTVCHSKKSGKDTVVDTEMVRGASSIKDAARAVALLAPMDDKEFARTVIPKEDRRRFFKMVDGKSNYELSSNKFRWFRLSSVKLRASVFGEMEDEWVGVPVPVRMADYLDPEQTKELTPLTVGMAINKYMDTLGEAREIQVSQHIDQLCTALGCGRSKLYEGAIEKLPYGDHNNLSMLTDGARVSIWREKANESKTAPLVIRRAWR